MVFRFLHKASAARRPTAVEMRVSIVENIHEATSSSSGSFEVICHVWERET